MAVVAIPIVLHTIATLFEKPSKDELESDEQQASRRIDVVTELVESLKDEDLTIDKIGRVKVEALCRRCSEMLQVPRSSAQTEAMAAAVRWLGQLAEKELRIGLAKSAEQPPPPEYADGSMLDRLDGHVGEIEHIMSASGQRMDADVHKRLWVLVHKARQFRRQQRRRGLMKAVRFLLKGRESLKWVFLQSLASIAVATVQATSTYYRASVLDTFTEPDDVNTTADESWEKFKLAAHAMFYVEMLATLLNLLTTALRDRGAAKMGLELRLYFFSSLLKKDLRFWTSRKGPWHEMIGQVFSLDKKLDHFVRVPQEAISMVVQIATSALLVMQRSSRMLYIMVAINWSALALNYAFHWVQGRARDRALRGILEPSMDDFTWVHALNPEFVATFQSFVRGTAENQSFARFLSSQLRRSKASGLVSAFSTPLEQVLTQSSSIAQYATTGNLVARGVVGVGQATALMHSARGISSDTQKAIGTWNDAVSKAEPLAKAWDLCTLPPSIDPDVGVVPSGRAAGHVIFEAVEFKYPERDVLVLKGASFEASPGMTIGMTGSAGCGKSTALRLLERFYDVTGGRILLDGRDLREYNPDWLRAQIATVAQEPKLLPVTILENIVFGCPPDKQPKMEEVYEACKAANIYDSLMDKDKFPEGLRTKMNAVTNVSGGEKQRIAIARAILADPPILLLDEATSALDEENQEKVQSALNTLMKGRTTLIIAHRLSTIRTADRIVAFDEGKVVESGSHAELLQKKDSIYAKLWHKQAGSGGSSGSGGGTSAVEDSQEAPHTEEHELGQFNEPLTPSTRLGRVERKLGELQLDKVPTKDALLQARASLVALAKELQVEAGKLESDKVATILAQGKEVIESESSFAWRTTISSMREQLLASSGQLRSPTGQLQRLVRKAVHEQRSMRSVEDDLVAELPLLPRRAATHVH